MLAKYHSEFLVRVKTEAGDQAVERVYDAMFSMLQPYDSLVALIPLAYKVAPIPYALVCAESFGMVLFAIRSQPNVLSNVILFLIGVLAVLVVYNQFGKQLLAQRINEQTVDRAFHEVIDVAATYMAFAANFHFPVSMIETIKYFGVLLFLYLMSKVFDFEFLLLTAHVFFHICVWVDFFIKDEKQINTEKIINDLKKIGDKVKEKTAELKEKSTEMLNKAKSSPPPDTSSTTEAKEQEPEKPVQPAQENVANVVLEQEADGANAAIE